MSLDEETVDNALANLRASGAARVVYSKGMRVDKYKHAIDELLGLDRPALAVLTVMLLRGPQTVAELRTRTERLHGFADADALQATLESLAAREPALVNLLARQPGQKEQRWNHLLGPSSYRREPDAAVATAPTYADRAPEPAPAAATPQEPEPDRLAALEARVAALEARLDNPQIEDTQVEDRDY